MTLAFRTSLVISKICTIVDERCLQEQEQSGTLSKIEKRVLNSIVLIQKIYIYICI